MEDKRLVLIQKHIWYTYQSEDEPNVDTKVVAIIDNEKEGEKYVKGWTKNSYGNYEVGDDNDWYERTFMTIGEEWYL